MVLVMPLYAARARSKIACQPDYIEIRPVKKHFVKVIIWTFTDGTTAIKGKSMPVEISSYFRGIYQRTLHQGPSRRFLYISCSDRGENLLPTQ